MLGIEPISKAGGGQPKLSARRSFCVNVLKDDDQSVLVRYEYDVFGAIQSEVGTSDNSRKFTGKEYESDVKLYYFAARYYDLYIGL